MARMCPEAAIVFGPSPDVQGAVAERVPDVGEGCMKEEGADVRVGRAEEEMLRDSGEEAMNSVHFMERSAEVMGPEATHFPRRYGKRRRKGR
jgi:hypothetical protein